MKKKSSFAKVMQGLTLMTVILSAGLLAAHFIWGNSVVFTLFISFFTTFFHFAMRLIVGCIVPNRFDPNAKWFQPSKLETAFYKKLKLKHWKDHMPTYNPSLFSLEANSLGQIAKNMCQAEVVHEVIILCSFLPMLFIIPWGEFWVFFITSLVAAIFDSIFVMLQRYNRPRIMKLLKYQSRRSVR